MIFVLSFAVFGASGVSRPFPSVELTSVISFVPTANVMNPLCFSSSGREIRHMGTLITAMETGRSPRPHDR